MADLNVNKSESSAITELVVTPNVVRPGPAPHKNFAYSTVLTAPSPATTGTSLVVQSGDGAKYPSVPFNITVWAAGANPVTTNAEVMTVTAISTDTLTIVRAMEGSSARTVVVGDQVAATVTTQVAKDAEQLYPAAMTDFFERGCVWTADAAGSTLKGSMTPGIVWIRGVRLSVASITAHAFTASKDTYVDFTDNGDGTAAVTYTEATNNAASSALAAAVAIRNAIIVTGAGSIAAASSINQGSPAATLPTASSAPYISIDSLGNYIYNTNPIPSWFTSPIGAVATAETTASTSYADLTTVGPAVRVNVPASGRVILMISAKMSNNGANTCLTSYGAVGTNTISGADAKAVEYYSAAANAEGQMSTIFPLTGLTAGITTFTLKYRVTAGTGTFSARTIIAIPL